MGRAFTWGIVLLVIALVIFLAAIGIGGEIYAQQGAYCIAAFFVLASLPFFITALRKRQAARRETATAREEAAHPVYPLHQTPPQSRARSGVFLPQARPEQQGRNTPRQEER